MNKFYQYKSINISKMLYFMGVCFIQTPFTRLIRSSAFLFFILLLGCEDDPDICIEAKPFPVLYAAIDKYSPENYVIVSKTFSGDGSGPLVNATIWDSVYFENVQVYADFNKIDFTTSPPTIVDTKRIVGQEQILNNKDSGVFRNPDHQIFRLSGDIEEYYDGVLVVKIPGYDTIFHSFMTLSKPVFLSPNHNPGSTIKFLPNDPLNIFWKNGHSADVELVFIIESKFMHQTITDSISYRVQAIPPLADIGNGTVFYYDQFKGTVSNQLAINNDVISRSIVEVQLIIAVASTNLDPTKDYNPSVNYYYEVLSSGNQTIYGKIFNRATDTLTGLGLHYLTHEQIYYDPDLKDYHFTRF